MSNKIVPWSTIAKWKDVKIQSDGYEYHVEFQKLRIGSLIAEAMHYTNPFLPVVNRWEWRPNSELAKYLGLPITKHTRGISVIPARRFVKIMLYTGTKPNIPRNGPFQCFDFPQYVAKILNDHGIHS